MQDLGSEGLNQEHLELRMRRLQRMMLGQQESTDGWLQEMYKDGTKWETEGCNGCTDICGLQEEANREARGGSRARRLRSSAKAIGDHE